MSFYQTPQSDRLYVGSDQTAAWQTATAKAAAMGAHFGRSGTWAVVGFLRTIDPPSGTPLAAPFIELIFFTGSAGEIDAAVEGEAGPAGGGAEEIELLARSVNLDPRAIGFVDVVR